MVVGDRHLEESCQTGSSFFLKSVDRPGGVLLTKRRLKRKKGGQSFALRVETDKKQEFENFF